jgi:hypothetical protein
LDCTLYFLSLCLRKEGGDTPKKRKEQSNMAIPRPFSAPLPQGGKRRKTGEDFPKGKGFF